MKKNAPLNGIVIDTNLLVPFCLYALDEEAFVRTKFEQQYSISDMRLVARILSIYKHCYITPYIIAELYNLAKPHEKSDDVKKGMSDFLKSFEMIKVDVHKDVDLPLTNKYGIIDAHLASQLEKYDIFTNDRRLVGGMRSQKNSAFLQQMHRIIVLDELKDYQTDSEGALKIALLWQG